MSNSSSCPACSAAVPEDRPTCACGYGLRARPCEPRPPRFLGEKVDTTAEKLAASYRCSHCASYGAKLDRVAVTGAGLGRLLNWQSRAYLSFTCRFCGAVQLFDRAKVEASSRVFSILDALLG